MKTGRKPLERGPLMTSNVLPQVRYQTFLIRYGADIKLLHKSLFSIRFWKPPFTTQYKPIGSSIFTSLYFLHSTASPLTQCQKEYQEILRSWILPGPYIPQCTHDGRYEQVQCQRHYCYCVNENGVEYAGTRVDITEGRPKCHTGGDPFCLFTLWNYTVELPRTKLTACFCCSRGGISTNGQHIIH